jgi:hypothetical protein
MPTSNLANEVIQRTSTFVRASKKHGRFANPVGGFGEQVKPMTEAEWLNETGRSQWMMDTLQERKLPRTKSGWRKLRLFACGCCRAAWDRRPDARLGDAVETAERFADRLASNAGSST